MNNDLPDPDRLARLIAEQAEDELGDDEEPSMRKCTSCNWEFDGTGTKCPDCRINDGDVLDITPFQAHALIKATEAIADNPSEGRYRQDEIDACIALRPHLRAIAGDTTEDVLVDYTTTDAESLAQAMRDARGYNTTKEVSQDG